MSSSFLWSNNAPFVLWNADSTYQVSVFINPFHSVGYKNKVNKYLGFRNYELSNHLGNVLAVISDRKYGEDADTDGELELFKPNVLSETDYYAFGSEVKERSLSGGYRFGYQGSEQEENIQETITTFFREGNLRLGRWWSYDPKNRASQIPYCLMGNNPTLFNDVNGDKIKPEDQVAIEMFKADLHLKLEMLNDLSKNVVKNIQVPSNEAQKAIKNMLNSIENMEKSEDIYNIVYDPNFPTSLQETSSSNYSKNKTQSFGQLAYFNEKSGEIDLVVGITQGEASRKADVFHHLLGNLIGIAGLYEEDEWSFTCYSQGRAKNLNLFTQYARYSIGGTGGEIAGDEGKITYVNNCAFLCSKPFSCLLELPTYQKSNNKLKEKIVNDMSYTNDIFLNNGKINELQIKKVGKIVCPILNLER